MTLPRVITEELGGSPLALAAQRGDLPKWYLERPRNPTEWRAYLARVAEAHTSAWLEGLAPALEPSGEARSRLNRVVRAGGVVVSTGQQAALFGGPLYTLVKAIGAVAVADALEQVTGIPTATVFWAATDDADYEEARSASIAVTGGVRTLSLPPVQRADIPMSDMPMPGVERLVEELAQACGSVSDPEPLEVVRAAFTSRATLGAAYVRQLRALLEPLGIAVLDASHGAVRQAAAPVLTRALSAAPALERALEERRASIGRDGFVAQVEQVPGLSLVFASDDSGEKRRIPVAKAAAAIDGRLAGRLSPNVLLRPIVERFIMPSAGYVAGPGELAYFAQVSAVADVLELPRPLPIPRWSATIVEARIERLLDRLAVSREELRERPVIETRLARARMPEEVRAALEQLGEEIEANVVALGKVDRDHLVPPASLEGLRRALRHRLKRAERRYVAAVKRRETEIMRDVATAAGALHPNGSRQERVLNFVPFLARYGQPLVTLMRDEAMRYAATLVGAAQPNITSSVAERV